MRTWASFCMDGLVLRVSGIHVSLSTVIPQHREGTWSFFGHWGLGSNQDVSLFFV